MAARTTQARRPYLFPAANLEFFSTAAGARVVAPDFRAGPFRLRLFFRKLIRRFADQIASLLFLVCRAAAEGAGLLVQRLLLHVAQKILERHHARRAAENIVADLRFDVDHQFVENFIGFRFVFHQRITAVQNSGFTEMEPGFLLGILTSFFTFEKPVGWWVAGCCPR